MRFKKNKFKTENENYGETKNLIKKYFWLVLGVTLLATGFNLFFLPFNLVCFGVSGFSIVTERLFGIDPAYFILIASVVLLIISFLLLGWHKTKNSIIGSLLFPIFVKLTANITELIDLSDSEMIIIAIFGGAISGFGAGLVYKMGFTTGGTDILNQIVSKYLNISIGKALILVDGIVILLGMFVFGIQIAIYGIVVIYIFSIMADKVILGISESKFFNIVTDKEEEIHNYLVNEIGAGVTIIKGEGGFSGETTKMLLCVIPTRQYFLVKQGIQKIDNQAFFVVTDAYEVGNLKRRKKVND